MDHEPISLKPPERENCSSKELWITGLLEVGGYVGIARRTQGSRVIIVPEVRINDNSFDRLQKLQQEIGGRIYPDRRANSSTLLVSRIEEVLSIAEATKNHSLLRKDIFTIIAECCKASPQQKQALWEQARSLTKPQLSSEQYMKLASSPAFLAGVLDGRGIIIPYEKLDDDAIGSKIYKNLRLNSQNLPLLQALQLTWGGAIEYWRDKVLVKEDERDQARSFTWNISSEPNTERLLNFAKHEIRSRDINL